MDNPKLIILNRKYISVGAYRGKKAYWDTHTKWYQAELHLPSGQERLNIIEPRHVISNNVAFWQV